MPNYEYRCESCKSEWDAFHSIETRYDEWCSSCGERATKTFRTPHAVNPDMEPHYDYGLGKRISSRRQRKERMQELGRQMAEREPWRTSDRTIEEAG
jgi:putative FmdB family regulatory protein